jgi:SAM-dependent methyltransferase
MSDIPKSAAGAAPPSPWVVRFLSGVRPGGQVLDLACGRGRHTRLALSLGYNVTALDRDLSPLGDLAGRDDVELIAADLEDGGDFPLTGRVFDGVIVTNYLWRPILPNIVEAVAKDGVLIYETFAIGHERFGHPRNPEFLLRPWELLAAVSGTLTAVAYEHVTLEDPPRLVQHIAAVGPDHAWQTSPQLAR